MKKLLFALFAAATMVSAVYADPLFENDVTFHISFDDETVEADISEGSEKIQTKFGNVVFANGIAGKALVCGKGGAKIRFHRPDNLNFNRPGTIVFFYKGVGWDTFGKGARVFFWEIESSAGYIGQQLANDPKTLCPCQRQLFTMFLYGKKIPNKSYFTRLPGGKAGCCKWHMLAFSWAPGQIRVNADNTPGKSYPLPFEMTEKDFPNQTFSIGNNQDWPYLLDEFTIYNRRLSDAELLDIYNKTMGVKK